MTAGAIVLLALLMGSSAFYIVDIRDRAILLRLGEMVETNVSPGLHLKVPLIDSARIFDGRLQTLDIPPERFLTQEKKNLIVDFYVKWRIDDVARYYRATGGNEFVAAQRLEQIVKDGLRSEFGRRTVQEAVSGDRANLVETMTTLATRQSSELGIEVKEVRIKRMDLPNEVSSSVFARMEAERARTARELRAEGGEAAEAVRAEADRQREVMLAEAYRDAERLRGEGDRLAAEVFAEAHRTAPEFYAFYRSLQAYRQAFAEGDTTMVLSTEEGFFDYFRSLSKAPASPAGR
ncbi:protease modulator HflC [Candidatus Macondimonas diazotrophica]|jgi:membrane protease subunit HflC|nr:protease modulator HflC [Candidatus Macondimonas diazotrophica]